MIHVEDLTGISKRTTAWSKDSKARLGNWAFYQLQYFIAYKARMLGVKVKQVDSAYTSQRCHNCGHIDKANRLSQSEFLCTKCGYTDHADINAAKNIAFWINRPEKAVVNQPIVASRLVLDELCVTSL